VAVARRKAIESREKVGRIMAKREQLGQIVHSTDGHLFFLTSKDARRTRISSRDGRTLQRIMTKQEVGRQSAKSASGCTKTLRWLLSHNPKSVNWRKVSAWWISNC
jgi:hypothetical protein